MATSLPTAASFTGSTVTEAQFKSAMTDMRTYLNDLLGSDGVELTALKALNAPFSQLSQKTANYTILDSDLGTMISANSASAITFTTPAAATVSSGWNCTIRNRNTGTLTIDGNASETIDDETSITLEENESVVLVSNGTNWVTMRGLGGLKDDAVTTSMIADNAATWAKLGGGMGNVQKAATSTPQTATSSWVTYLSDSITIDASSGILVIATINFDASLFSSADYEARVLVDGSTVVDSIVSTRQEAEVVFTMIGFASGLSSGARTVALQIQRAAGAGTLTAETGDVISIEVKNE